MEFESTLLNLLGSLHLFPVYPTLQLHELSSVQTPLSQGGSQITKNKSKNMQVILNRSSMY